MKALIAVLICLLPTIASAQTYEWTDDQGRRNFTDNYNRIPEQYRSRAVPLDSTKPTRESIYRDAERRAREDAEAAQRRAREDAESARRAYNDALRERAGQIAAEDAKWNQAAGHCAQYSRVQIAIKPGARVTILGNTQQRFNFEKCMTESGFAPERY